MTTVYRDAGLKIDRANKHIEDFRAALNALKNACISTIEHRPDGGESIKHELPDLRNALDGMSLIAGDAVHNLRTALDFAWYSTIKRCLPDKLSDATKFPVREDRHNVKGALHGIEVDTRCEALFECIMDQIQPYYGGNNSAVWTLHQLDISDKHILLLGLDPSGYIKDISVRDANGELHKGTTMTAPGLNGLYAVDFERGLKVENKGKLSFTVTLQEAGIFEPLSVVDFLQSFSNFVAYSIKLLENITCG